MNIIEKIQEKISKFISSIVLKKNKPIKEDYLNYPEVY